MTQAGFNMVFVGIETPDEASLGECGKRQNRGRDLVADVQKIQRAGLQVQGGFIVAYDNDAPTIFQRQVEFIQKSGIVTAMVGMLVALPGTRLHERLKQAGRLLGPTTGNNSDGTTNFRTGMNREALREGYHHILRHLCAPSPITSASRRSCANTAHIAQRPYSTARHLSPAPAPRSGSASWAASASNTGASWPGRLSAGRASWMWPSRLAIYGHHFRRTCEALGL